MSRILVMDEALGPADGDQEVRDRISTPHPRAGSVPASRAGTHGKPQVLAPTE
jgi:hypothetical protein